jgi:hypothetical protein
MAMCLAGVGHLRNRVAGQAVGTTLKDDELRSSLVNEGLDIFPGLEE